MKASFNKSNSVGLRGFFGQCRKIRKRKQDNFYNLRPSLIKASRRSSVNTRNPALRGPLPGAPFLSSHLYCTLAGSGGSDIHTRMKFFFSTSQAVVWAEKNSHQPGLRLLIPQGLSEASKRDNKKSDWCPLGGSSAGQT